MKIHEVNWVGNGANDSCYGIGTKDLCGSKKTDFAATVL